jgi:hypothetical protein
MAKLTQTQVANDIAALIRARTPFLWIVTPEEARAERLIIEVAAANKYVPRTWDAAHGVCDLAGRQLTGLINPEFAVDPTATLRLIRTQAEDQKDRGLWIMRDLPSWLEGPIGITPRRHVRNLCRLLPGVPLDYAQVIVVITTNSDVPTELAAHTTVIEWPRPTREEIGALLDATIAILPEKDKEGRPVRANAAPNGTRDAAIDAALGLTSEEARGCFTKSLVQLRKVDPVAVAAEKKRLITRERVIEWYDPIPGGLDAVGGLDDLKVWIKQRKLAYTPKAREFGLPAPKGAVLVGVQGCGKSLSAKAIATDWGVPLLRVDLGAMKSKFVGESEQNLRKAFSVIESIGRCVLWFDEVEKALAGSIDGAADGGVSSDVLGFLLTWMQERAGEAFVLCTSNDVSKLPAEFLRKGRFDEIWFVDLPTSAERVAILKTALKAHKRDQVEIDHAAVAAACDRFNGAEVTQLIPEALFVAFADNAREITTADLIAAAKATVPLAETAKEKIEKLRDWAKAGRARRVTPKEEEASKGSGVELEI